MKLLKQKTSGEIYVWSEDLAKRDDMEEFVRNVTPTIVVPPEPIVEPKAAEEIVEVVKKPGKKSNGKETSLGNKEPKEGK